MFDGRIKKIIAFLKEKLAEETEPSRNMLKTYSDYIKDEATDEELEKANNQLNELLKDLSLGLMTVIPFAPITIPDKALNNDSIENISKKALSMLSLSFQSMICIPHIKSQTLH